MLTIPVLRDKTFNLKKEICLKHKNYFTLTGKKEREGMELITIEIENTAEHLPQTLNFMNPISLDILKQNS